MFHCENTRGRENKKALPPRCGYTQPRAGIYYAAAAAAAAAATKMS